MLVNEADDHSLAKCDRRSLQRAVGEILEEEPRALAEVCELIEHVERSGVFYVRPDARLLQAKALLALHRIDECWEMPQAARHEAEAMSSRRLLGPILTALFEIDAARGELQAGSLRQQARQRVRHIAAHAPTSALRQGFLDGAEAQAWLREGA